MVALRSSAATSVRRPYRRAAHGARPCSTATTTDTACTSASAGSDTVSANCRESGSPLQARRGTQCRIHSATAVGPAWLNPASAVGPALASTEMTLPVSVLSLEVEAITRSRTALLSSTSNATAHEMIVTDKFHRHITLKTASSQTTWRAKTSCERATRWMNAIDCTLATGKCERRR